MSTRTLLDPRKWREERATRKHLRRVAWLMAKREADASRALMLISAAEHLDKLTDNERFMAVFRGNFIEMEKADDNAE